MHLEELRADISAERLSSAMTALGAECAARSTIRDTRGYWL